MLGFYVRGQQRLSKDHAVLWEPRFSSASARCRGACVSCGQGPGRSARTLAAHPSDSLEAQDQHPVEKRNKHCQHEGVRIQRRKAFMPCCSILHHKGSAVTGGGWWDPHTGADSFSLQRSLDELCPGTWQLPKYCLEAIGTSPSRTSWSGRHTACLWGACPRGPKLGSGEKL